MIQARLDALQVSRFRQENEEAIGAHCYSQLRMSAHKWVSTRRYPSGEKPGMNNGRGIVTIERDATHPAASVSPLS